MSAPQFDPVQEKAELSRAIGALLHSWGKPDMAQAVATFRAALAHAEHALAAPDSGNVTPVAGTISALRSAGCRDVPQLRSPGRLMAQSNHKRFIPSCS